MLTANHSRNLTAVFNLTAAEVRQAGANWRTIYVIHVILTVLAFTTNGCVIAAFVCRKSLRTSFNIYLLNLVAGNFIHTVIENPLDLINHLYPGWRLSWGSCTLYIYSLYVVEAGIRTSHVLITVNRIWAVIWPHGYRTFHRKSVACLVKPPNYTYFVKH